jgi:hypothetical protein
MEFELKLNDIVAVIPTNNIGMIIDMGNDDMGIWFRTDCDGTRERMELIHVKNVDELTYFINSGFNVAPSVMRKISEKFVY